MSEDTKIEWCDHTFNPWEGCTKVSPGCAHCYAEARNERFRKILQKTTKTTKETKGEGNWGKGKPRRRTAYGNWRQPYRWAKSQFCCECGKSVLRGLQHICSGRSMEIPTFAAEVNWRKPRVFCLSIGDVLDEEVPIEWLADLLGLIYETPNLDWLLLTKRPENWRGRMTAAWADLYKRDADTELARAMLNLWLDLGKPPANVWVGTSVEDQERADERIPELLRIPAKVRFLSVEPMLGAIDFNKTGKIEKFNCLTGKQGWLTVNGHVDWVIFGGESGPGARPCNVEWIRDGNRQCREAGVKIFNKQLGARAMDGGLSLSLNGPFVPMLMRLADKKGGDMSEWPEDLRVREWPESGALLRQGYGGQAATAPGAGAGSKDEGRGRRTSTRSGTRV